MNNIDVIEENDEHNEKSSTPSSKSSSDQWEEEALDTNEAQSRQKIDARFGSVISFGSAPKSPSDSN